MATRIARRTGRCRGPEYSVGLTSRSPVAVERRRSCAAAGPSDGERSRALRGRESRRFAEDADYGMILGTGFSPFRGGPLRYAEHLGLNKVVDELERLARTEEKFLACEILKKHARDGTRFYAD